MMKEQNAAEILKLHSQRTTEKRLAILELLMSESKAFALSDIESHLSINIDRVTIYRTLNTFEAVDLVTKMVDHQGTGVYMFNHKHHNTLSMHPHLRCKECGKITCLPSLPAEYLETLKKYQIDEMYFLMEGVCEDC